MNDDKKSRLRKNMIKGSADKLAVLIFKSVIEEEKKGRNCGNVGCKDTFMSEF